MSTEDIGLKTPIRTKRQSASAWRVRRQNSAFARPHFSTMAALIDGAAATMSAICAGVVYNALIYAYVGVTSAFVAFSVIMTAMFVVFNVLRNEYDITGFLAFAGHARRVFVSWNIAFLVSLVIVFMTKHLQDYSRVGILLVYFGGLLSVIGARAFVVARIKTDAVGGKISAVRIVLVGYENEVADFMSRYMPWTYGVEIIASFVLRGAETLDEDLALAAASARVLKPDDIYILLPLSEAAAIDACVEGLVKVPASIHLGPQRVLDRFSSVNVSRVGKLYSLNVVRRPLANVDVIVKRVFDLLIAAPLLIGLAPLFVLVAIAIKIESRGPVLFRQRRYGFNQETFQIVKFRSMRVSENGRAVRQAVRNDPRVTRVGQFIRRFNIDELPQLLNVLAGQMSLVGPRPHALVHNQYYERSIADYARRHNVKPGITGWAQIHGLRGEISTEAVMRRRIDYDLFYIDNWTMGLDLRILAMTVFSLKAFVNAY